MVSLTVPAVWMSTSAPWLPASSPPGPDGTPHKELRTFSTVTADLLRLADWLLAAGCTHVAMESTGIYWRPVYNVKVLEDANLKLAMVATDIMGVSGRAIFAALIAGETDPARLADLARGTLQKKREQLEQALQGHVRPYHAFLLAELLSQIAALEDAEVRVTIELDTRLHAEAEALELLDTIPGVNRRIAQIIIAEIGTDMGRFPSAKHLASWAGLCPGNHESAGKQRTGRTRKGSRWLRQAVVEAAHGAAHTKHTYLAALYHRLAARRGRNKATLAVAHAILVICYHLLTRQEPYRELGANYFDERVRHDVERRLLQRLQRLGYTVVLQPVAQAAP